MIKIGDIFKYNLDDYHVIFLEVDPRTLKHTILEIDRDRVQVSYDVFLPAFIKNPKAYPKWIKIND